MPPYVAAVAWLIAQAAPTNDPWVWLGAATPVVAVGAAWIRDLRQRIERLVQVVEQQGPILIEMRDVLRSSSDTLRAAAEAMSAMAETAKDQPNKAETTRLRDALAAAEARLRTRATGR